MTDARNFNLKEEIRSYWSDRSETFDLSAGHRIAPGAEAEAWRDAIANHLGTRPLRVLELACGTGEITGVLHDLGHDVTALDFSEPMLARARAKHSGKPRLRFLLADAQNTMEPDAIYDAVVCRHLAWTLTEPEATFREWRRVLKPGGTLLVFDGDWAKPTAIGYVARALLLSIDRLAGTDGTHYDGMAERHEAIMQALPFGDGLTAGRMRLMLEANGFTTIAVGSQRRIANTQRSGATMRNRLRTLVYRRFVITAKRSP